MRIDKRVALVVVLAGAPSVASATDGHFLHGVGAINSAMAGVGVASPSSLLGAFYVNPAGLLAFKGTNTELGFELFKPERTINSSFGTTAGSTASTSEFVPIPAFGWSRELRKDVLTVGVAGLGIGGFGVDYPVDPTNPTLAPRPYGFGSIYSNFSLMKIIPALAFRPAENVRVGVAVNVDWASLAVDPMPTAAPAVDPGPDGTWQTPDDRAYYSRATDADGSFGIGAQLGVQMDLSAHFALGLAYTSPQVFQKFKYDAVYENPNLPSYNTPRSITFAMDVPAVYAAGLQYRPVSRVALRGGYNYSENPIPNDLSMFNTAAPAVVQHHLTLGAGYAFSNGFGLDVAYYHAFKNSIDGPFQTPAGAMPGTSVKSSMSENSMLIGFTFSPPGLPR